MSVLQIILLAVIQGAAEMLPVSSSAHVIVAEKLMGLDPSAPEMTFLLVMLHTGTMVAVLLYFSSRWRKLNLDFFKKIIVATAVTGVLGLALKKFIEKVILGYFLGESKAEIEHLFKSMPLISLSLFLVGCLIFYSGWKTEKGLVKTKTTFISTKMAAVIGMVQGLCLPFRGFSRSGATISTAMLGGISRDLAEDFSFGLAVALTPAVIVLELYRLIKATGVSATSAQLMPLLGPGLLGMLFSFAAGLLALKWLSSLLEKGRWKYFGVYCWVASAVVLYLHFNPITFGAAVNGIAS